MGSHPGELLPNLPPVSCPVLIQDEKVMDSDRNTFDNSQVRRDVKP